MRETDMTLSIEERLFALQSLVSLGRADLMYADQYLRRAEMILQPLCTREQHTRMSREQRRLPEVSAELNRAVQQGEWQRVGSLAGEAARVKEHVASQAQVLAIADAVYGPRTIEPDAQSLSLAGIVKAPRSNLEAAREALIGALRRLVDLDAPWAGFYRTRIDHFAAIQLADDDAEGPVLDPEHLKRRLQEALQKGHFQEIQRLADVLAADPHRGDGRVRVPSPAEERIRRLAEPFPDAVRKEAAKLGLAAERLAAEETLNSYLSCCCADRARFPTSPLSETHRKAEGCTCGHGCPPELPAALRDNFDLLIIHPFITSAGTRYLPWFGKETLLVETFSEEGADAGAFAEALGLPRRMGLPRIRIEDALANHGSGLCADLGLDPIDCAVVCIPFDAYLRLAPKYGWGRQQRWTHFDGYQVLQHAHLRALVGGDARYGGPYDLCSVERYYDPERLLARFAIVKRDRFTVRQATEGSQ